MAASAKKEQVPSFFEALYKARDADAHEISEGLFLGAASAAEDRKAMQKRRITHVLICHPALPEQHAGLFKYGRVPIIDEPSANILEMLPGALSFLAGANAKKGRAFVYCAKGISRSSSIVIAYLMFEHRIGFDEAFKRCEQKRPIVYPNVGFQQQLRHLELLLASSAVPAEGTWEERAKHLRKAVPSGSLSGPSAAMSIEDEIGSVMGKALADLEANVDKVMAQPQLLQQRELWKRQGLFFENLHKYKALPSSSSLLDRAREAATKLRALPKIFSDSLKGVKLALAVVKELEAWAAFAEPLLRITTEPKEAAEAESVAEKCELTAEVGKRGVEDIAKDGKKRKTQDDEKQEDEKRSKKERKADKKMAKAAKKAEKLTAKMEKAAQKAERQAKDELRRAEMAEAAAKAAEEEEAELEAEDAFEGRAAAAGRRVDRGEANPGRDAQPSRDGEDGTRHARYLEERGARLRAAQEELRSRSPSPRKRGRQRRQEDSESS